MSRGGSVVQQVLWLECFEAARQTQVHGDRELDVVSCDLVHFLNLKFLEDDLFAALFVLHMITATLLNWFESCRVRSRH